MTGAGSLMVLIPCTEPWYRILVTVYVSPQDLNPVFPTHAFILKPSFARVTDN